MVHVREERCSGCGVCLESCPQEAIQLREGRAWVDATRCNGCGACVEVCPNGPIEPVQGATR
ncbi:MAG: 4Fe-4S binding protein, partial [Chloroflexia bacterium]